MTLRQTFANESGQMAVIAVLLVVAMAIGIAVVSFLNQVQGKFGVAHQKRQEAHFGTQTGLDYALQVLANPTVFSNALLGFFPAEFTDGGTPHFYDPGGTGNAFTIEFSTGAT